MLLKDYYGMVAVLREFPRVKMTFNLVPSLLVQLRRSPKTARDRFLELSLKPPTPSTIRTSTSSSRISSTPSGSG